MLAKFRPVISSCMAAGAACADHRALGISAVNEEPRGDFKLCSCGSRHILSIRHIVIMICHLNNNSLQCRKILIKDVVSSRSIADCEEGINTRKPAGGLVPRYNPMQLAASVAAKVKYQTKLPITDSSQIGDRYLTQDHTCMVLSQNGYG